MKKVLLFAITYLLLFHSVLAQTDVWVYQNKKQERVFTVLVFRQNSMSFYYLERAKNRGVFSSTVDIDKANVNDYIDSLKTKGFSRLHSSYITKSNNLVIKQSNHQLVLIDTTETGIDSIYSVDLNATIVNKQENVNETFEFINLYTKLKAEQLDTALINYNNFTLQKYTKANIYCFMIDIEKYFSGNLINRMRYGSRSDYIRSNDLDFRNFKWKYF